MEIRNFSESQLQQLVNTEITMYLYDTKRRFFHPIIINLIEEYKLGWDTAFYFPWLQMPPHPNHRGCNFFIQYKLSELIEGHRAEERKYWNHSYFRFQIPYSAKRKNKNHISDDYHQFDSLKELADNGYFVYYATNHVVKDRELFKIANNQDLLNEIPFLDVSKINGHHKKVTFDQNRSHFLLHSEPEKVKTKRWFEIIETFEGKKTVLSDDIHFLENFIMKLEEKLFKKNVRGYLDEVIKIENREDEIILKPLIISKYLRKYLGVYWLRY